MNTKLTLSYADEGNYKQALPVILQGKISTEQITAIQAAFYEGEFIICDQVGLPTPAETFQSDHEYPTPDDHCFSRIDELQRNVFDCSTLHTKDEPTLDLDIETLVSRFQSISWDIYKESVRVGIL